MDLFDQYEQSASNTSRSISNLNTFDPSAIQSSSIINIRSENEMPLFNKTKFDFAPPDVITHLVVSNNHLVIALRSKLILRIDLQHIGQSIEIDISKSLGEKSNLAKIYQLFLDPTGKHCVISLLSSDTQLAYDNLYLSKKVQQMTKMKGHIISAIGWNYTHSASNINSTSNILIGTTKGLIFETEIVADEKSFFGSGPEQYWKQVFDLGVEAGMVTGIEFHRIDNRSANDSHYFIMVTSKNRLYQFVGHVPAGSDPPFLHHVFNMYNGQFQDMPGNLGFSKLDFHYPQLRESQRDRSLSLPKTFAWLTEPGVFFGQIDTSEASVNTTTITGDTCLIAYEKENEESVVTIKEKPISMILTQFHVLLQFRNKLKVICVLNEEVVMEDHFTETYGNLIGIVKDAVKGTIIVFSEMAVYRYKVNNEDRNIWRIYLEKGDFNSAKLYARNDPVKLDKVICDEAQNYFNIKNYSKSASLYALSHKSFEEIALKFLQVGEDEALKQFLVCKLDTLSTSDVAQTTMLLLWLLEIILNQMGSLRNSGKESSEEYDMLEAEFQSLLTQDKVEKCLAQNSKAIYGIISSHGHQSNLIYFAQLRKDYDRVVQYYLQHKNYKEALKVLQTQGEPELFYMFSPAIMHELPNELITVLIQLAPKLDSAKLIPALVQPHQHKSSTCWSDKQGIETIRYLEYCAYKLGYNDAVIHNYLLALYAQMQSDKLMTYLSMKGQDESTVPYDLKYALRICTELGLEKACVHLYSTMGMFEEAVDLALTFDIELAKQNADKLESNEELRKKLWLKIAKHVIKEENDVKNVTKILDGCELLKIEDILPFFPDFITIDNFKEAICSSLTEYNRNIESLKDEMKSATESATEIREEIKAFRNKFSIVRTTDKCVVCAYAILTRAFYVFPCGHMFHSDCIISEVKPHLKPSLQSRIEEIRKSLSLIQTQNKVSNDVFTNNSNSIAATNNREKLLSELDEIVSSECLYCGNIMINSIDQPFIQQEEVTMVMEGWD